jgi:signal transduction histidine kinase
MQMSVLTIAWSMAAAACWILGLMHLLLWSQKRQATVYLLSSLMAFSAGASAMLELGMLSTQSLTTYRILTRWENFSIFMILVPMVWFVYIYFGTGRRWLVVVITLLWSVGLLANFFSPHSLTFSDVTELKQLTTFWGENFTVPVGSENPWKYLADIASILIIIYVADASLRLWRQGRRQRAVITGGGILFFITVAGIHAPLVDAGLIQTPYMISFAFLAIVATMSYQLTIDAIRARDYEMELQETRRTLDQLARSNMLGECTTMIAHELNQPLTAILSNAQAARRYLDSGKTKTTEIGDILDDIVRDDKRASDIIHRLRHMVQKEKVIYEPFDLNASIMEVIDVLFRDMKEKKIRLITQFSDELPKVRAGQIEIQQVVLNFLTNAIKVLDHNSISDRLITIHTSRLKNDVLVDVEDSGPGIPADIHETLFNSFVGDSKDGLGLGLSISRRIIETYEGHIRAENKESGGAVLSFTLPIA